MAPGLQLADSQESTLKTRIRCSGGIPVTRPVMETCMVLTAVLILSWATAPLVEPHTLGTAPGPITPGHSATGTFLHPPNLAPWHHPAPRARHTCSCRAPQLYTPGLICIHTYVAPPGPLWAPCRAPRASHPRAVPQSSADSGTASPAAPRTTGTAALGPHAPLDAALPQPLRWLCIAAPRLRPRRHLPTRLPDPGPARPRPGVTPGRPRRPPNPRAQGSGCGRGAADRQ